MSLQKDGIRAVMSESVERRTLERVRIDYAPDYKSEKQYPDPQVEFQGIERRAELQRLKDVVVETAKAVLAAYQAPGSWHWTANRAQAEQELRKATRALIEFESLQEKK